MATGLRKCLNHLLGNYESTNQGRKLMQKTIITEVLYWDKDKKKYKTKTKVETRFITLEELKKTKAVYDLLNQGRKK